MQDGRWYKAERGISGLSGTEKPDYPIVSGREIFEEMSITRLNSLPVVIHENAITKGATLDEADGVTVPEITKRLLVDGTLVRIGGEFLEGLVAAIPPQGISGGRFAQLFRDDMRLHIVREYTQVGEDSWQYQDFHQGKAQADAKTISGVEVFWNGLGILYPVQWTYRRLEQVANNIRRLQTGAGLKTIVHGLIRNPQQTKDELNNEREDIAVVSGETRIDRATSTNQIDKLNQELRTLQNLYYQHVNITDTTYQPDRPSGADRMLQFAPQSRFIEAQRKLVDKVFTEWFNSPVEFSQLHTASVQDRTLEYQLLLQMRDEGVISPVDFVEKAAKLA